MGGRRRGLPLHPHRPLLSFFVVMEHSIMDDDDDDLEIANSDLRGFLVPLLLPLALDSVKL